MKYERFEDLPVWRAAIELAERVFVLTDDKNFMRKGDLSSQLRRASVSVSNNIAEGFERGTTQELLTFLYIARGSAGEVRSMLILTERLSAFAHLKQVVSDLKTLAEGISRQLRAWADSLQNSPIRGHRYLNEQTKLHDEQSQRAEAFWDDLKEKHEKRIERLGANFGSEK